MNCCRPCSTNNSDGGTEVSGEDWSIKTNFEAEANANVNATFTICGIQENGGSANSIPASRAAAATAAAAAAAAAGSAAAIAAATASPTWEDDLQAQMQEWFRDSDWVDEPPSIAVTMGSGAVCQLDSTATVALPPDAVFNVIRDPNNRRVFKNVKVRASRSSLSLSPLPPITKFASSSTSLVRHPIPASYKRPSVSDVRVLRDDGAVQHAEMKMTFVWRLPAISGTFTAQVLMIQDRPNRMVCSVAANEVDL
ncbi:unnamed protein product [Closterium sp. Yama58-4]|nr:unnamed protein product [Closterium sp. Yama58-4]